MGSFSGLLNNAALMLVLCVVYDTFGVYAISNKILRYCLTGVLVGLIGIAVMLNPWSLQPGVFFDTRWVLLSLCGLFFGLAPTAGRSNYHRIVSALPGRSGGDRRDCCDRGDRRCRPCLEVLDGETR